MVTDPIANITCPLCRSVPQHNCAHFILNCPIFNKKRCQLSKSLSQVHGLKLNNHTVYKPRNLAAKMMIDKFLLHILQVEKAITQEVSQDLTVDPAASIGAIVDAKIDNEWQRFSISDYNFRTHHFTLDSGNFDLPPHQGPRIFQVQDLNTFGNGTFERIPSPFALKFHPINCDDNIGKLYFLKGKVIPVNNPDTLLNHIRRGLVNSCPYNGNVARRYHTAFRRECNANLGMQ